MLLNFQLSFVLILISNFKKVFSAARIFDMILYFISSSQRLLGFDFSIYRPTLSRLKIYYNDLEFYFRINFTKNPNANLLRHRIIVYSHSKSPINLKTKNTIY